LEVVAQAGSLAESRQVDPEGIDVALVDAFLPDGDGAELIREFGRSNPRVALLALTASFDPAVHARLLEAGADEVHIKNAALAELVGAIRRLTGSRAISPCSESGSQSGESKTFQS
jgi:DNA-binding NarL/FixJ family response regulator